MTVTLEHMNSIVIRIDRLQSCRETRDALLFLADRLENGIGCHRDDDLLVMPGGQNQMDVEMALNSLASLGLKPTQKLKGDLCWRDVCVINSSTGPTIPCPWLDWNSTENSVALKASERTIGTVIFAHGKESGPQGDKIMALAKVARKHHLQVIAPDFRGMDNPDERVAYLCDVSRDSKGPLILVGSSMGGYAALNASQVLKPDALFLMAPAIGIAGYDDRNPESGCSNVCIVHAWQDEVIPVQHIISWAGQHNAELHLVESDHRLSNKIDLLKILFEKMLKKVLL